MEALIWLALIAGIVLMLLLPTVPFLIFKVVKTPRIILSILLIFLPIHTLFFQVARVELNLSGGTSILLQSWKELLIFVLILVVATKMIATGKYSVDSPKVVMLTSLFMLSGLIGVIRSPSVSAAIVGARGTFEPFLLLVLVLCIPLTMNWLRKMTPLLLGMGSTIAVFAISQSLILGYRFVQKYYATDGILPTSFSFAGGSIQRAMGTFSSPNQLSLYLVFLLLIAVNLFLRSKNPQHRIFLVASAVPMSIALVLTVSRSGWVAMLVGMSVSFVLWRRKSHFIATAILVLLITIPTFFMFGLDQHFVNTIEGNDPSANYRTRLTATNLNIITNNPLGVGIGTVGARAQSLAMNGIQTYSTESYLLQMTMELGVIGILLFLLLMMFISANLYRNIFKVHDPFARAWGVAALSCLFAALAHAVFIPDLQDLTVASYLCTIIAIGLWLPRLERTPAQVTETKAVTKPYSDGELLWMV